MDTLLFRVAGLDIHKKYVMACVRLTDPASGQVIEQLRRIPANTAAPQALAEWLAEECVTDVALRSKGDYWKPIWRSLEGRFRLLLADKYETQPIPRFLASHIESQWLSQLLARGLLTPSFIPDQARQELHDLIGYRSALLTDRTRVIQRLHRVLKADHVRLAGVSSEFLNPTEREVLAVLINGDVDPDALANLTHGRLHSKLNHLKQALAGQVTSHHRFMLDQLLDQLEQMERQIALLGERIQYEVRPHLEAPVSRASVDEFPEKLKFGFPWTRLSRERRKTTRSEQKSAEVMEPRLVMTASVPAFSSLPGANHTIYLDFDGHVTENTPWNSGWGVASINSPAYDIDANPDVFSTTELARIGEVFQRVSEDFIPFQVNVTTVDPGVEALRKTGATDTQWGVRVVITKDTVGFGGGGIAYVDSFTWDTDSPCFVFLTSAKSVAEAVSHETGHTLGLSHDGLTTGAGYYSGHGSGETGWAPVMGVGYYQNVTTWDKGEYFNSNNAGTNTNYGESSDDLAVIVTNNGFTYRVDDHGNYNGTSSALSLSGTSVTGSGIIERTTDVDVFRFTTGTGLVSLNINPFTPGPNLDVKADLYDAAGTLVATSNPSTLLAASFSTSLTAGTYYLHIDGSGVGTPTSSTPTGYSDYASLGRYSISGTIITAAQIPTVSVNDVTIDESAGTATFNVSLQGSSASIVTVAYVTADGTAVVGGDYLAVSGTLTFNPGETSKSITVTILDDTAIENSETFFVNLTDASAGLLLGDSQGMGTINASDVPPPQLSVSDVSVNEANGTATFTISLTGTSTSPVTVDYATANGSATASSDYTAASGTLTFAVGETSKTVSVAILNDTLVETAEGFSLNLSNPSGAILADSQGQATINDNDNAVANPNITINDVSISEGNLTSAKKATYKTLVFTLNLSSASSQSVTVSYATQNDTATTMNKDYQSKSGTVTFAAGVTSKTVSVTVVGDNTVEASETFKVVLSNAIGGIVTKAQGIGTISNDDGSGAAPAKAALQPISDPAWYFEGLDVDHAAGHHSHDHLQVLDEAPGSHDRLGDWQMPVSVHRSIEDLATSAFDHVLSAGRTACHGEGLEDLGWWQRALLNHSSSPTGISTNSSKAIGTRSSGTSQRMVDATDHGFAHAGPPPALDQVFAFHKGLFADLR